MINTQVKIAVSWGWEGEWNGKDMRLGREAHMG